MSKLEVNKGERRNMEVTNDELKRNKETIGCSDSFFKCTNYCYECKLKDDPFNCFDFRHLGDRKPFEFYQRHTRVY